jgi:hypothetical protein
MKIQKFKNFLNESDNHSLKVAEAFCVYILNKLKDNIKNGKISDTIFHPKCQVVFVPKDSKYVEGSFDKDETILVKCDLGKAIQLGDLENIIDKLNKEIDDIKEVLIHEWIHLMDYEKKYPDVFKEPDSDYEYYNLRSELNANFFGLVQKNMDEKDFKKFSSSLKSFLDKNNITLSNRKNLLKRAYKLWKERNG